jgi:hypothetical protein
MAASKGKPLWRSSVRGGMIQSSDQQPDGEANMFEFDGQVFTAAQMLEGNAHDDDVCEFVRSAAPGDVFCGCTCIQ